MFVITKSEEKKPKKRRASGAGIKAKDGVKNLERKQIHIDAFTEELFTAIGDGNLSLGIREAARRLAASKNTGVFIEKKQSKKSFG